MLSNCLQRAVLIAGVFASHAAAQAGVTRRHESLSAGSLAPFSLERGEQSRRVSPWVVVGQLVGGTLAAGGAGLLAWSKYDDPYGPTRRVQGDEGYTPNANTAYAIGSFAGVVTATQLIGRTDGSHGGFLGAVLGAAIPTIPLLFGRDEPYLPLIGIVIVAPLQAIGATIGDQSTRRRDSTPSPSTAR
jgi:hypothetical protein